MIYLFLCIALAFGAEIDVNTFSNYIEVSQEQVHIEWLLDLDEQYINATSQSIFRVNTNKLKKIDLDIYQLSIIAVYLSSSGNVLQHEIIKKGDQSLLQGDVLSIQLDRVYTRGEYIKLNIKYNLDSKGARALGFLTKEQTYSKTVPYLFSQCEDNNCRSIIPLQDTPSIKVFFTATVLVKDPRINVFMTGNKLYNMKFKLLNNYENLQALTLYQFELDIKIPAYLIGIIAGEVVEKSTGNGTYVIAEPHFIDEYAEELSDLPVYMNKMQEYIGPYIWGDYKIVILPASFPFGGMEHPLLTFASPTIIVGDKSGVGTAIHEIAHSWVGNTVTGRNWANFWINEGFCVFLERKILSRLNGLDSVKLDAINGNSSAFTSMQTFGLDNSFSSMHPNTTNRNPDEATSRVPYEKGYQLLTYLESLIKEEPFQQFLRDYIENFKFQSIDEDQLYQFLLSWVRKNKQEEAQRIIEEIQKVWKKWVYNPGLAPITIDVSTPLLADANNLAKAWIDGKGQAPEKANDFQQYKPNQKSVFLQYLIDNYKDVEAAVMTKMDEQYKLTFYKDQKTGYKWYRLVLLVKYDQALEGVHDFVSKVGVSSYLKVLYDLLGQNYNKQAYDWFEENKSFYHPVVVQAIEKILQKYPKKLIIE
ncbi:unnamed protein product [Paramecium octaurelia]|uniref:Peptidase M1 leukotriene A4 hydrolase/aminopeptidase C-terminal domain-containing protein n=1 Tax=Paramecium octaurelia TaxID=43137 RepID=A0A8S1W053_PAROT|nr:unnamed protein product [Paramecium octaurelia]